jgi:hypothetical protein
VTLLSNGDSGIFECSRSMSHPCCVSPHEAASEARIGVNRLDSRPCAERCAQLAATPPRRTESGHNRPSLIGSALSYATTFHQGEPPLNAPLALTYIEC